MKRKVLSLILCVAILAVCFSVGASATVSDFFIPGEIVAVVTEAPFLPDVVGDFELYGVVFASMKIMSVCETSATLFLVLPEGANSQEETETAIATLKQHPEVLYAEQNFELEMDDPIEDPADTVYKLGDVDGDGIRNTVDYIIEKRVYMGTYVLEDDELAAADVDGDGTLTTADYLLLKRSVMKTYNIQLPMTPPTETQISDMVEDYIAYISPECPEYVFAADDVFIFESEVFGTYGNGECYVMMVYDNYFAYMDELTEYEIGGRTLEFSSSQLPLCWDGNTFYSLKTAYENGLLDDMDLEDLETRYNIF